MAKNINMKIIKTLFGFIYIDFFNTRENESINLEKNVSYDQLIISATDSQIYILHKNIMYILFQK